jgi:hypothetical protein
MKGFFFSLLALFFLVLISSCEDVIQVDLPEGESQLCVDGILTNDTGVQVIKLRMTQGYLDNAPLRPASGAVVRVTDLGNRIFEFKEGSTPGNYEYRHSVADPFPFGIPGNLYSLSIEYSGEVFESLAYMDSVPVIDSLGYSFEEQDIFGGDTIAAGYVLTMKATDLPGEGDGYWFRTWRNGVRYNKPEDINLAYDAAFGPGSDGVDFIPPIVFNLSPERFQLGDTVWVECLSIGLPTFAYLSLSQGQMLNGGLFAEPPANVPTNIQNKNKESKVKAVGWFAAAAVSRKGLRIKP